MIVAPIKKAALRVVFLLTSIYLTEAQGQIQIRPLPEAGYEQRIRDAVNLIRIVDTHEHLMTVDTLRHSISLDFMLFLYNYPMTDFVSAGMPYPLYKKLWSGTSNMTVSEKWHAMEPYWPGVSNTGFSRSGLLSADRLFGVKTIDASTVESLSQHVVKAYGDDPRSWFYSVLRDKCGIQYIVEDSLFGRGDGFFDPKMIKFVQRFDDFIWINSNEDLESLSQKSRVKRIEGLDDLVAALRANFAASMSQGIVGVKSALAYRRTLYYARVTRADAARVLQEVRSSRVPLSFARVKPLQDYMMHRVLDLVRENNLPIQFHTGFQWGFGNKIEDSKPTNLINLLAEYPDVKFILFHGSYPYGGELAAVAKSYQNAYIDTNWTYILSPSYAERYLHEWLETIPVSKIMAFGGDDVNVEAIYGHLLLARQIISNVMISKVRDGYFTEDEAIKIVHLILRDNAMRLFKLN
jgi:uncharacterized protein